MAIHRGREFRTIVINLTWSEFYANSCKAFFIRRTAVVKFAPRKRKFASKQLRQERDGTIFPLVFVETTANAQRLAPVARSSQAHFSRFVHRVTGYHHLEGEEEDLACSRCSEYTHVIVGEWRVWPLTLAGVRESVAAWPVMSWQHRVLRWRAFRGPLRRAVACPGEAGLRW